MGPSISTKAMREVKRRTEAPGDAATVEQREEWRRLVEDFLKNERNLEQAEKQKQAAPSKLNRMATFDLACACDRQLGLMTQSSWSAVDSHRDVDKPLQIRTRAALLWDRGPTPFVSKVASCICRPTSVAERRIFYPPTSICAESRIIPRPPPLPKVVSPSQSHPPIVFRLLSYSWLTPCGFFEFPHCFMKAPHCIHILLFLI